MGKGATLAIEVIPNGREPIFLALARAIMEEIQKGRLKPGMPLPGTRALSASLRYNRNTIDAAYHELIMQGWLVTEPAKGTFVAHDLPNEARAPTPISHTRIVQRADALTNGATLRFSDGTSDVKLMPTVTFAQALRRALSGPAQASSGVYGETQGIHPLREALSAYLRDERGLATSSEDILVTSGSQMALFLAASAVLHQGDAIAVEQIGYPLAWSAFRAAGLDVLGVPVNEGGIDVDAFENIARTNSRLRAVYLTPHYQYPTTVTLEAARRTRLLDLARNHSLILIEDDYCHEFRFEGRPIMPLAARSATGPQVIYVGSLSKLLAPGIRVGYAVASRELVLRMSDRREALDRQGNIPLEHALAELLADGTIKRHARKSRFIYKARRDDLAELLTARFSDHADFTLPTGGLAIWLKLKAGLSAETWSANAARLGLSVLPGSRFNLDATAAPEAFRLGFAHLDQPALERAVGILAKARP